MCWEECNISFVSSDKATGRTKDLCNKDLLMSRGLICYALNAQKASSSKVLHCLDGNTACGLMGMLWCKYLGDNIRVTINGIFTNSSDVIKANLTKNKLDADVTQEDPCILLRKNSYDFVFLNCRTLAAQYLDSLFCKIHEGGIVAITTSEDPSLYWQFPSVAMRMYNGAIVRTSYFRELGIRLVIAEMVRAAAKYNKGISILCSASFRSKQSFTIVAKVMKGAQNTTDCLRNIKRLLHCSICEDRAFVPGSDFVVTSLLPLLSCECSKNATSKVVNELGPVWAGPIFSDDFISAMLSQSKKFPWEKKVKFLILQILEEARCSKEPLDTRQPEPKKSKLEAPPSNTSKDSRTDSERSQPCFYFNTHRHHPEKQQLQKIYAVIRNLQLAGFRASRTHFDPEAVRTNASLQEYIQVLKCS